MREMIDVGEGCEEGASRLTTIPLTQIVEESVLTFESDDVVREKKKSSELGADDGDGEVGSERLMSASKIHNRLGQPDLHFLPRLERSLVVKTLEPSILSEAEEGVGFPRRTRSTFALSNEGERTKDQAGVNVCDGEDSHRVGLVDTPLLGPRTEPTTKFILHRRVPKRDPLARSCRVGLHRDVAFHADVQTDFTALR